MPSAQDIIMGSRVAHVRELKAEIARLKADNARLRDESAALAAHFDMALLAAADLRALETGRKLVIVDGWNMLLGAKKGARDRADLVARWKDSPDRVWIVFDGPDEAVSHPDGVRVSYTGGTGAQRADRFVCDFLRMAKYLGLADRVEVRTNDKDFLKQVEKIKGRQEGRTTIR